MSKWYKKPTSIKASLYKSSIGVVKKVGTQSIYKSSNKTFNVTTINSLNQSSELPIVKMLKKLFVPSTCLQGNKFQIHLLWNQDTKIAVKIIIPEFIKVIRINNAENATLKGQEIYVDNFEENGFLGIIFKTETLPKPAQDVNISFIITNDAGITTIETRTIHLFRPDIKLKSDVPEKIKVIKDSDSDNYLVENRICLANAGEGMGIISFRVLEDSEIPLNIPKESKEIVLNFWSNFILSLTDLLSKYPQHEDAINGLIHLGKNPIIELTEDKIEELKTVNDNINKALDSDLDFLKDFTNAVLLAFMKNIRLMKHLDNFILYLKSIESNKIILNNPTYTLQVISHKKVKAEVDIIDRNFKSYQSIPLEFEFELDNGINEDTIELPIHDLFNFNENS